jgi:predicted transcriptional regulator
MPSMQTRSARTHLKGLDFAEAGPSIDWRSVPSVSDDECVALLAKAVEDHDPESLDEVAWLIGRLAVPIE